MQMKTGTVIKGKKISFLCFIFILMVAIIHITISAIGIYNNPYTSFPWHAAIFFTGIFYIIPLIVSLCIFLYFFVKSRQ